MWPVILLILCFGIKLVALQNSNATCSPDFAWALNQAQQSPCLVAAYLGHQCSPDSPFNVPPISQNQQYLPPTGQQINSCQCSSVYYSLLSACAMCQGSSLDTFTVWTQGCPQANISMGTYPLATPSGTVIPPWAYLPLSGASFDLIAAGRNATGDADFGRDSPALSTAAIVGLTLGSVAALLLVIAAIWLYCRTFAGRSNYGQVHTSSQNTNSERSRVRYDKIEGPPRKPHTFMSRAKVVSYRPGLNFDLDKGRTGDLVELTETAKLNKPHPTAKEATSSTTISNTTSGNSAFASRTSIESSSKHTSRRVDWGGIAQEASGSMTHLFSRPKEVKPQKGGDRLDLAEDGNRTPPSPQNPPHREDQRNIA
ncbi:hypothetical protein CPB86DRAFT_780355 [Serendipita vermifera]|nr:hypothetical protein CPB86DRAFT_780355 [Serendipita vermifera]